MSTQLWRRVWDVNSALWTDGVNAPSLPIVSPIQGHFLHRSVEACFCLLVYLGRMAASHKEPRTGLEQGRS